MFARTIWNSSTYREITELIREHRPDVVHCHNTFPLISPSVYWAAAKQGVPVVQTLHNYRLVCINPYLYRNGHICEDCLGRSPLRGVIHRCYRNSFSASFTVAAMLVIHRLLGTYRNKVTTYIALTEFGRQKFLEARLCDPARVVVKPNAVGAFAPTAEGSGFRVQDEEALSRALSRALSNPEQEPPCAAVSRSGRGSAPDPVSEPPSHTETQRHREDQISCQSCNPVKKTWRSLRSLREKDLTPSSPSTPRSLSSHTEAQSHGEHPDGSGSRSFASIRGSSPPSVPPCLCVKKLLRDFLCFSWLKKFLAPSLTQPASLASTAEEGIATKNHKKPQKKSSSHTEAQRHGEHPDGSDSRSFVSIRGSAPSRDAHSQISNFKSQISAPPTVLYAGRLSPEKGPHLLLEAWRLLVQHHPEITSQYQLIIAGEGPERMNLEAMAKPLPTVSFIGQLSLEKLHAHMAAAHVLVLPSTCYETFAMSVNEAASLGTPAIVSDIGGQASLVEDGATGFTFRSGSVESLAETLAKALADPARLAEMGRLAQARFLAGDCPPERNVAALCLTYAHAVGIRLGFGL